MVGTYISTEIFNVESQVANKFYTRRSEVIMDILEKWNDGFSSIFSSGLDGLGLGVEMLSDLLVGDLLSQNKSDKVEKFSLDFLGIFYSRLTTVVIISEK